MSNKININDIFHQWLSNYKRTISFSIIDKPSKALGDSFNAGYTLSEKQNHKKMSQIKNLVSEMQEKNNHQNDMNRSLVKTNKELENYIEELEEKLGYSKKRA